MPYGETDGQADHGPTTSMAYTGSGPGWSSVLTGVWPDRHGVTGNDFAGADYLRHPDFLTRAATVRPGLRTAAAVSWAEPVRRGTLGSAIGHLVHHDGDRDGYGPSDALVADHVARRLTPEDDPDAVFVYFGATDEAGHDTGPLGPAYDRALRDLGPVVWIRPAVRLGALQPTRAGSGACSCKAEEGVNAMGVPPARAKPSVGELATDDNAADVRDIAPEWHLQGRVLPRESTAPRH
ncbi:alkaline phosphatase family protein [Streptomyces sp. NPDC048751]|uniref:alkaline phosphatase family protein n=1 Tax=Streptomyces sp. NPDC048751 TaxID=3365591 RepID=UPI00371FCA2B